MIHANLSRIVPAVMVRLLLSGAVSTLCIILSLWNCCTKLHECIVFGIYDALCLWNSNNKLAINTKLSIPGKVMQSL